MPPHLSQPSASASDPQPQLPQSRWGAVVRKFFLNHPIGFALSGWILIFITHRLVVLIVDEIALFDLTQSEMFFFGFLLLAGFLFSLLFLQVIQRQNFRIDQEFEKLQEKSNQLHTVGLLGLVRATAARDTTMALHMRRVGLLAETLGRALAQTPKYRDYLSEQYISDLSVAAALHDVGRVGIEDAVLHKGSGLSADEFEKMKMHVIVGGDIIAEMERTLPFQSYYTLAKEVTYHHHQRWDGTGYPNVLRAKGDDRHQENQKRLFDTAYFVQDGVGMPLKGEEIPLSARIVAVADVYDALVSRRRYREPISHDQAVKMIAEKRGNHFDPAVVDAFLSVQEEMHRIVQEIRE